MKIVHCKREPFSHYIGRPGIFGNRHPVETVCPVDRCMGMVHSRDTAIKNFEIDARADPDLLAAIKALPEDAVLGCWCAPKPCHGMVIRQLWIEQHNKEK